MPNAGLLFEVSLDIPALAQSSFLLVAYSGCGFGLSKQIFLANPDFYYIQVLYATSLLVYRKIKCTVVQVRWVFSIAS